MLQWMWRVIVKKMLFVIRHLGIAHLYMGLMGQRHRHQVPGPFVIPPSPSSSPTRTTPRSTSSSHWEVISNPEGPRPTGQEMITPEIRKMVGPPPQCDHLMDAQLFVSLTEKNNRRLFWRCPYPRTGQCQFFMWCPEQPLIEYQEYQHQMRNFKPPQRAKAVDCKHLNISKTGTNAYRILEKCLDCQKILIDRKTEKAIAKDKEKVQKQLDKSIFHQENMAKPKEVPTSHSRPSRLTPELARRIQQSGALEMGGVWMDHSESQ